MQLSDEVRQFILQYINSVDQLEILLLLKQDPTREWTAEEIARTLSTGSDAVASRMAGLASDGLIQRSPKDETRYRYGPRTADLDRTMTQLAQDYPQYRVSIINLIFSKPIDKIRTFADAFRFTKRNEEEE
jgi:hypothetical protein